MKECYPCHCDRIREITSLLRAQPVVTIALVLWAHSTFRWECVVTEACSLDGRRGAMEGKPSFD